MKLYINGNLKDEATFGAQIRENQHEIIFQNPLLPSGYIIADWGNADKRRRFTNGLPIIFPGDSYSIILDYECKPIDSILLQINLYFRNEVKRIIISEKESVIDFPENFSFNSVKFELINIGNEYLKFKSIKLYHLNRERL